MRDWTPPEIYSLIEAERRMCEVAEQFGYRRIETPAVEHFHVLALKSGEEIINEIYYFRDKAGRELGLRFDMTVPIARVLSYRLDWPKPVRLYYFSKVWRYDEPQHGRYREFYQFGIEHVGSNDAKADAEVLTLMIRAIESIGAKPVIRLNDRRFMDRLIRSMGIEADPAPIYRILDKRGKVSDEEVEAALRNRGLRDDQIRKLLSLEPAPLQDAVDIIGQVDKSLATYHSRIVRMLDAWGVLDRVVWDPTIVRGLDYYTGVVFEAFVEGYKLAVGGGGRYDTLIGLYSGFETPALGFAIGVERLLEATGFQSEAPKPEYYIYPMGDDAYRAAADIAKKLLDCGKRIVLESTSRSLSAAMDYANRLGAKLFVIVGPRELSRGHVKVRDLERREEWEVPVQEIGCED